MHYNQMLNSKWVWGIFVIIVQSSHQWKTTALSSSDSVTPCFRLIYDLFDMNAPIMEIVYLTCANLYTLSVSGLEHARSLLQSPPWSCHFSFIIPSFLIPFSHFPCIIADRIKRKCKQSGVRRILRVCKEHAHVCALNTCSQNFVKNNSTL